MAFISGVSNGTALANAQVSVDTSATEIVAASPGRAGVILTNQGSTDAFIGTATVTTSNGFKLAADESIGIPTDSVIQAIVASGSTTIGYLTLA